MTDTALREAAQAVLDATDARRDAINGKGHEGEPHDRDLAAPDQPFIDTVGDCTACAGRQYGTEDDLNRAMGDLRAALGHPRLPWEPVR